MNKMASVPPTPALPPTDIWHRLLLNLGKDLSILEQEVFLERSVGNQRTNISNSITYLVSHFDGISTPPWKKDSVSSFYLRRYDLAILVRCAWTDGDNCCLWERVVRCRSGEEDPGSSFLKVTTSICIQKTREKAHVQSLP